MACYAGETLAMDPVEWDEYWNFHRDPTYCQLCRVIQDRADAVNYGDIDWHLIGVNPADGALMSYDWAGNPDKNPLQIYKTLFNQMRSELKEIIEADFIDEDCKKWAWDGVATLLLMLPDLSLGGDVILARQKQDWQEFVDTMREVLDAMQLRSEPWLSRNFDISVALFDVEGDRESSALGSDILIPRLDPALDDVDCPALSPGHTLLPYSYEDFAWSVDGSASDLSVYQTGGQPVETVLFNTLPDWPDCGVYFLPDGTYSEGCGAFVPRFNTPVPSGWQRGLEVTATIKTRLRMRNGVTPISFTGALVIADDIEFEVTLDGGGDMTHTLSQSSFTMTIPAGSYDFTGGLSDLWFEVGTVTLSGDYTDFTGTVIAEVVSSGAMDIGGAEINVSASYEVNDPGVIDMCEDACGKWHVAT